VSSNWPITTLGAITELITKGTTPTSVGFEFAEAGVNFVKVESISLDGHFIAEKFDHISAECNVALRRSQLATGDILFSIAGALGRTAKVIPEILPANTNQALAIVRLKNSPDIVPDFVLYALSPGLLRKQIEKQRGGVAQQNLSLAQLKEFKISLPSREEQLRVVAVLDEALAGLATAAANAEKNLRNARELFDSYLNSIFAQGWKEETLGSVCENMDSRRIPVTKSYRKAGTIPYYGASGVVDYVNDFIFDEDLLLVSEDGANLLMRTYPIAFSISGKSWVNNHAHVLRFTDTTSQKFVEYYLNSISLKPFVNGMAQPKLNQKALNSISVPFPPLKDQERVVAQLNDLSTQTERLRESYEVRIIAFAELKQSIVRKAFSGELTSAPVNAIKEAAE
jgi:type I restriction enzyme S subunit